jgi:oligosaccharide repeat unit polymerase
MATWASEALTAGAALSIVGTTLYLGRRDVTRPAVAFGAIWFGCVAMAQLRLTEIESPWTTGFTVLVFTGAAAFILATILAGGTAAARGRIGVRREDYRPRRLVIAALVLLAGGVAGQAYKAHVLGGVPLLSGRTDELRARAYQDGEIVLSTWSSALTNGFFLAMWCALAALWLLHGRSSRQHVAGLWLLAAMGLFGVTLMASRNTILLATLVPLIAAYVLARPRRRVARAGWLGVTAGAIALVVGGLFVARISEQASGSTFLDRELKRHPAAVRPILPFYMNGVYPLEAASRLYRAVPVHRSYALGGYSLTSLPDATFPEGKAPYGATLASLMRDQQRGGLSWSVATYQGRLYGDAGWPGVVLASLLLGLAFGALYRWGRSRNGFVPVALVGYLAYYAAFMAYDNLLSFTLIAGFDLGVIALLDLCARGQIDEPLRSLAGLARRVGVSG